MFVLPSFGSDAREAVSVSHIADVVRTGAYVVLSEAKALARRFWKNAPAGAVGAVYLVLLADDTLALVSIGKRGGVKTLHTYGKAHEAREFFFS